MKSGAVSLIIQASENSSPIRVTIAPSRPMRRARGCWSAGSFPDRIEMKMMLSTPRTISRNVSVASAIQISGFCQPVHRYLESVGEHPDQIP